MSRRSRSGADRLREARSLSQYAKPYTSRTKLVQSANPLISTVPDDTRRVSRQVFRSGLPKSPILASRASHRSKDPRNLSAIVSGPQLLQRALRCASRAIRREVLFAHRLTGKGSKATFRRRTAESKEVCR